MTASRRPGLLTGLALALLAGCERPPPPRSEALPAPPRAAGPSEPAPRPSEATDDYEAARRASRTAAPTGADAMPGFEPAQRLGTDFILAPVPRPLPR